MNFDFDEDQYFIKNEARRFLEDRCQTDMIRECLENKDSYSKNLWGEVVDLGWLGIAIPEEYGGLGMGYLELCVIAEELGRVVAPIPFSSSIYLAVEAIMLAGSEEQKKKYLPQIASGEKIATIAWVETAGVSSESRIQSRLVDNRLNGCKIPVLDGMSADIAIVLAVDINNKSVLTIVDLNGDGVDRQSVTSVDPSSPLAKIQFSDQPAEMLGQSGEGWATLQTVLERAAVLYAFEQIGGADKCLELAVEYAKERKTFGQFIGAYQGVKHKLSQMYAQNELARSNAYYGAWALATNDSELPIAAAAARVSASECFEFSSRESLHLHGGMGFTWEVDCHLYLKRSRQLNCNIGSTRIWKSRMINAVRSWTSEHQTLPNWLANA